MSAADGLLRKCWSAMICEPIVLVRDDQGKYRFSDEGLPLKTVIDVFNLPYHPWCRRGRDSVAIELDGREAVYDRIGFTPEGMWICRLRVDPDRIVRTA